MKGGTPTATPYVANVDVKYGLRWGEVLGTGSRLFGAAQGPSREGVASAETSRIAGKAPNQARFPGHIAADRSLHGKEGVDGLSPSEGSARARKAGLLLSRSLARSTPCGGYGALYGAPWVQAVATSLKPLLPKNREVKPKPLPWVGTRCRSEHMVKRGSTVRVRQRACRIPVCGGWGWSPLWSLADAGRHARPSPGQGPLNVPVIVEAIAAVT